MAVPSDYVSISVYLPPEVAKFVTEYAEQKKIVRRNKEGIARPALATAVVSLLAESMELQRGKNLSNSSQALMTKEEVEKIVEDVLSRSVVNWKIKESD
jgi:hypothetical protein